MVAEVLRLLQVHPGGKYIDATAGEGGHTESILRACGPGGRVLAVDVDLEAVRIARKRLEDFGPRVIVARSSYRRLRAVGAKYGFQEIDGVLLDLGISSLQLEGERRGFSFRSDDPLDLRFDARQSLTGDEVINSYRQGELESILRQYGEEKRSRSIARAIVAHRPIAGASHLARLVEQVARGSRRIHPATRVWQALRIYVNRELDNLAEALPQAVRLLAPGARLVVISYHSLEDRIVKQFMRREHSARTITRKPLTTSPEEVMANPRSRSAKLRACEKLAV